MSLLVDVSQFNLLRSLLWQNDDKSTSRYRYGSKINPKLFQLHIHLGTGDFVKKFPVTLNFENSSYKVH